MENKYPWFPFYAADFLVDENVQVMSNQEVGCYIKLMSYCWREGSIPNDVKKIARLCSEDSKTMAELWQNIGLAFDHHPADETRLIHPRLETERENNENFSRSKAEAGKKGALKRWQKNSTANGKAMAQLLENDSTAIAEQWQSHNFANSKAIAKNSYSQSHSQSHKEAAALELHVENSAAAISENFEIRKTPISYVAIPDEVEALIDQTIQLKQQDETDEVRNPGGLRESMRREWRSKPDYVKDWIFQNEQKKAKIAKQADERKALIEKRKKEAENDALEFEKREREERGLKYIESMTTDEYNAIYALVDTENDEAIQMFRGKMRDHAIKLKMIKILEQKGILKND